MVFCGISLYLKDCIRKGAFYRPALSMKLEVPPLQDLLSVSTQVEVGLLDSRHDL